MFYSAWKTGARKYISCSKKTRVWHRFSAAISHCVSSALGEHICDRIRRASTRRNECFMTNNWRKPHSAAKCVLHEFPVGTPKLHAHILVFTTHVHGRHHRQPETRSVNTGVYPRSLLANTGSALPICPKCDVLLALFLPRCMECRRGLAMRILSVRPSVCLSVCLSVTRVYCDKTEERSVQIFIPYERTFSLVF